MDIKVVLLELFVIYYHNGVDFILYMVYNNYTGNRIYKKEVNVMASNLDNVVGNNISDRIKSEQQAFGRVTNNDLVCKDCLQRFDDTECYGNTSMCEYYPNGKPNSVLCGGECKEYVQQ